MQFDTALNLVWLVLGSLALASTSRIYRHRSRNQTSPPAWLHVCGVALIVAALFPYISATDDVLRIQHADWQQTSEHHGDAGKKAPNDGLMRLYETTDTPVISHVQQISVTLFFFSLVAAPVLRQVTRSVSFKSGRSPPFASA